MRFFHPARHSSRRDFVWSAASLLCAPLVTRGQQEPTFSTSVKVVNLLATVRDKKGTILRDLHREDFTLAENGRPQTIQYFSKETDLPLTIGLMIDTSVSQEKVINAERAASVRFVDQVLRPDKDKVFIVQFDLSVNIRQGLTSSAKELDEALSYVDTPYRKQLAHQEGGGTLLYDAIEVASQDVMKGQRNRKALIVLSDGVDTGSSGTVMSAIEAAQRADTLVYSILFSDPGAYGIPLFGPLLAGPDGKGVLEKISKETGAGFFEVTKKQSVEQIFGLIQDELRGQYSLGYVSDQPVSVSEFRKIQLSARQKGLTVRTRESYWAQP